LLQANFLWLQKTCVIIYGVLLGAVPNYVLTFCSTDTTK
jgi:hypothetical protein